MMDSTLSGFISVGLWIDNVIYSFIGIVYNLLIDIANYEIFSQETIGEFSSRVYALLGIFMLFKLTFSLITYVVNPDDLADKTKGLASIGKNVIISLVLIVLTPYIFAEATNLQKIILSEHTLENLVFGAQSNSTDTVIDNGGKVIQFNLFSQFVKPNYQDIPELEPCRKIYYDADEDGNYDLATDTSTGQEAIGVYQLNPLCFGENNSGGVLYEKFEEADAKLYFENYKNGLADQNYRLLVNNPEVYAVQIEIDDSEYSLINYQFIISTVVGIVVLLVLITFCIDIAVRSIKLAFYQIIAPIPIITLCDPKSSKSGMFNKWMKACFNTYLSLFIRLLALYLAVYIISAVVQDIKFEGFALVFVIIGALIFAKELPKIITDLTGIKLDGKFTLNPFKKIENEALGGKSVAGAAGGMVAGAIGGHGFFGRIGSTFTGAARGLADGKGYESGLAKQADVNRKLRDARINGAGFWGSRVAAMGSKYGLDDAMLERKATNLRKNKEKIEDVRRQVDTKNKGLEVAKKAHERSIEPKEKIIAKQKDVTSSIEAMEKKAVSFIEGGKAGAFSDKYKTYKGYAKSLEQLKDGETIKSDIYGTNGKVIYYGGHDVVTPEMRGIVGDLATKYAKKEGKAELMNELLAASGTTDSANVGLNDVLDFKSDQNTYISNIASANKVINEYNSGSLTSGVVPPPAEQVKTINVATEYSDVKDATGKVIVYGVHDQLGSVQNTISDENISIKATKDEIEKINSQMKANITDEKVEYDGRLMTLEEAERRQKLAQEELDKEKQRSKINRDAAAASRIHWNGK